MTVYDRLNRHVGVCIDVLNLNEGDYLPTQLGTAVGTANTFVPLASQAALDSEFFKYEVNVAVIRHLKNSDYRIVVQPLGDAVIPDYLSPYARPPRVSDEDLPAQLERVILGLTERPLAPGPPTRAIVDRFAGISSIERAVRSHLSIVLLWGLHGIGKTSIARQAAAELDREIGRLDG